MKDLFSSLSANYSQYRPEYPAEIFEWISSQVVNHDVAWDCATGNGQVAKGLSAYFKQIFATDISMQQLQNAFEAPHIHYSVQSAEHTNFPDNFFDLITVGQAIHWFDFDAFYSEVKRTAKNKSILILLGYDLVEVDEEVDRVVEHFYTEVLKGFWDPERRYIDEHYQTLPFPFKEIQPPPFIFQVKWNAEQLLGFLSTWSAVGKYKNHRHTDPLELIKNQLFKVWGGHELKTVSFPVLLKAGRIEKGV